MLCVAAAMPLAATVWAQPKMEIRSAAFAPGAPIPTKYTCSGENISPALSFSGLPQAARSLALIVDDPDAPSGTFVHWVVYNLPLQTTHLDEAVKKGTAITGGGSQGRNDFGRDGYGGPCPPPGAPHHYRFRLFALNSQLAPQPATGQGVEQAIEGHVLASAEVVGTFGR